MHVNHDQLSDIVLRKSRPAIARAMESSDGEPTPVASDTALTQAFYAYYLNLRAANRQQTSADVHAPTSWCGDVSQLLQHC